MNSCSKNVDVISMDEFQEKVLDDKTVVLDVRTEEEYYGPLGHINGSILIPINELEDRLSELNDYKEKTIYVVCRSGNRSGFGKDILNENNFTAVNVDGGMLDWKADKDER
jgi:rhodanese-related sulfurtransferase